MLYNWSRSFSRYVVCAKYIAMQCHVSGDDLNVT